MYNPGGNLIDTEMPFPHETDYEIEQNFLSAKARIQNLMNENGLYKYLKESQFTELLETNNFAECKYFAEDEFIEENNKHKSSLNTFSFNIRSLNKHSGSW